MNTNETKYIVSNPSYQITDNNIIRQKLKTNNFYSSERKFNSNTFNQVYYESPYIKKCSILKPTFINDENTPQKYYQNTYSSNYDSYEKFQHNEEYNTRSQNKRNYSINPGERYIMEDIENRKNIQNNPNRNLQISLENISLCTCGKTRNENQINYRNNSEQLEKKYDNLVINTINDNIPQSITQFSQIQNSNVELSQETEEKTIILLPGQTVEPKNISEIIDDPIEEIIQYPDGTTSVILKQTKITKVVENFPIEVVEKNNYNGQKLPAIKQKITYYYKTVINNKDSAFNKENENLINNNNTNNNNINTNINNDKNNNNDNIDTNVNNDNNKDNNKELNSNEFLDDELMNKFLNEIQEDKATEEQKNKRIEYFKFLYSHICTCGKSEGHFENLDKISSHLINIDEKEKNKILDIIFNLEPKNEKLYKKLTELIKSNLYKRK